MTCVLSIPSNEHERKRSPAWRRHRAALRETPFSQCLTPTRSHDPDVSPSAKDSERSSATGARCGASGPKISTTGQWPCRHTGQSVRSRSDGRTSSDAAAGGGRTEQLRRARDRRAPVWIGKQAEVADAHEAAREHVQQKATEEFLDVERHDFRASAIRVVLPAEPHDAIGEADQSRVREGDAVGITTEVLEHLRRPGKRPLRIDAPRH